MSVALSIIIPVYNAAQYLPSCMESILQQEEIDLEIIAIDDCSTDHSLAVLQKYQQDKRVKVLALDQNGGQGNARNIGLLEAKGEFILFIDSDDYLTADKQVLQKLFCQMRQENLDILDCSYYQMEGNRIEKKNAQIPRRKTGRDYLNTVDVLSVVVWNKLYRRSFLIEHQSSFKKRKYEDVNFVVENFIVAHHVNTADVPFYNYVIRANSTMTSVPKKQNVQDVIALVQDLEVLYSKNKALFQVEKTFFYSFIGAARIIAKYTGEKKELGESLAEYQRLFKKYRFDIIKSKTINKGLRMALFLSPFIANKVLLTLKK
ncbi:glycosyltransferase family 2 protein [Myroides sp. DW712]|uniref:glycosyltransferase family 2 protein n=1 Tax=Myroides sp. DW712 TaxID=3389800 RepID=UPI00397DC14A